MKTSRPLKTVSFAAVALLTACGLEGSDDALAGAEQALHVPACADVTGGALAFDGTTVHALVELGDAPCKQYSYVLTVTAAGADGQYTVPLATQVDPGDALVPVTSAPVQLGYTLATGAQSSVCVSYDTIHNQKVVDHAPDVGCIVLVPNVVGEYRFE